MKQVLVTRTFYYEPDNNTPDHITEATIRTVADTKEAVESLRKELEAEINDMDEGVMDEAVDWELDIYETNDWTRTWLPISEEN